MGKIPKKILEIEDLVFVLPEGFHGNIIDALTEIIAYIKSRTASDNSCTDNKYEVQLADDKVSLLKIVENDFDHRVSLKFSFFEYDEDEATYTPKKEIE